jgi:hypothetical protein
MKVMFCVPGMSLEQVLLFNLAFFCQHTYPVLQAAHTGLDRFDWGFHSCPGQKSLGGTFHVTGSSHTFPPQIMAMGFFCVGRVAWGLIAVSFLGRSLSVRGGRIGEAFGEGA